jgi:hypothetical protein
LKCFSKMYQCKTLFNRQDYLPTYTEYATEALFERYIIIDQPPLELFYNKLIPINTHFNYGILILENSSTTKIIVTSEEGTIKTDYSSLYPPFYSTSRMYLIPYTTNEEISKRIKILTEQKSILSKQLVLNTNESKETCSICLNEIDKEYEFSLHSFNEQKSHKFHDSCIFEWYRNSNTCPICRQSYKLTNALNKDSMKLYNKYKGLRKLDGQIRKYKSPKNNGMKLEIESINDLKKEDLFLDDYSRSIFIELFEKKIIENKESSNPKKIYQYFDMTTLTKSYFYDDQLIKSANKLRICNAKEKYDDSDKGDCTMKNIKMDLLNVINKLRDLNYHKRLSVVHKFYEEEENLNFLRKLFRNPFKKLKKFVNLEEVIKNTFEYKINDYLDRFLFKLKSKSIIKIK